MADKPEILKVKHILVALDTSQHSRAALEAAVTLAKSMNAELMGLFVEDINWFRISEQSFSYEISDLTGRIRILQNKDIEQEVRAQASRLRKLMDEIGKRSQIKYTFKTVRGGVEEELLTATESADLITIGRLGRSFRKHAELGNTAKTIISQSRKPILILQHGWRLGDTNVVLYDGSEMSKKGLILAEELAKKQNNKLLIVTFDHNTIKTEALKKEVQDILVNSNVCYQIKTLEVDNLFELNRIIRKRQGG